MAQTTNLTWWRATPAVSLLLLGAAVAWVAIIGIAQGMGAMTGTMGYGFIAFAAVWTLMMAAMMLPGVAPFAAVYTRTFTDRRGTRITTFATGYLFVWAAAAIPAFLLALLVDRLVGHHPNWSIALAASIFAAFGVYQLTPMKDRCLARCRSPLGFVMKYASYRGPTRDARVGAQHGLFCLACCWGLMLLLFAFGVMNVLAMVCVASAVLIEKMWSRGPTFARVIGVAGLVGAVVVIVWPDLAPGLHPTTVTHPMGGM